MVREGPPAAPRPHDCSGEERSPHERGRQLHAASVPAGQSRQCVFRVRVVGIPNASRRGCLCFVGLGTRTVGNSGGVSPPDTINPHRYRLGLPTVGIPTNETYYASRRHAHGLATHALALPLSSSHPLGPRKHDPRPVCRFGQFSSFSHSGHSRKTSAAQVYDAEATYGLQPPCMRVSRPRRKHGRPTAWSTHNRPASPSPSHGGHEGSGASGRDRPAPSLPPGAHNMRTRTCDVPTLTQCSHLTRSHLCALPSMFAENGQELSPPARHLRPRVHGAR